MLKKIDGEKDGKKYMKWKNKEFQQKQNLQKKKVNIPELQSIISVFKDSLNRFNRKRED